MSQQPQELGYHEYGAPSNRSPGSRPNYTNAFGPGLTLPRQSQRPFDSPLGSAALYPSDRAAPGGGYPRGIDPMAPPQGMPNYLMENSQQPWNYNSSGVATVNGAVNGPSRQRSVNRRAALPQVCFVSLRGVRFALIALPTHVTELDRS